MPTIEELLQTVSTAWLYQFQGAARTRDIGIFKSLFHEQAVLWGIEKGGCCDWPIQLAFEFDVNHAKIVPSQPHVLLLAEWSRQSLVAGSPPTHGRATFFLHVTMPASPNAKGKVECVHAHFSSTP